MQANTTKTNIDFEFASLDELITTVDPQNGNYVVQLYGNTFIHQKPGMDKTVPGTLSAYQTDKQGKLHFISEVISEQSVSQLSVSADGRYFGFITNDGYLTTAYVYFLNTFDSTMEIAHSWSYMNCVTPVLFFSKNGQFAIFSPSGDKLHIQSLYTDESEVVFETPVGTQPFNLNYLVVSRGANYLVWHQPSGQLKVIDLIADQRPTEWSPNTAENTYLPTKDSFCMFYKNYVVHIYNPDEQSAAEITVLGLNTISQTIETVMKFSFPEIGYTWCELNSDGQSITLYNNYKHRETQMSVLLPEIITNFHDL